MGKGRNRTFTELLSSKSRPADLHRSLPIVWWRISDSNRSPLECKSSALPDELIPQFRIYLVDVAGIEPVYPPSRHMPKLFTRPRAAHQKHTAINVSWHRFDPGESIRQSMDRSFQPLSVTPWVGQCVFGGQYGNRTRMPNAHNMHTTVARRYGRLGFRASRYPLLPC